MIGEINKELKSRIVRVDGYQRRFAQRNKIPEDLVSRVVRGRFNLTADEQRQWAQALNCQPEEIFPGA